VPTRYRSSYFEHIWGGGYAAGYYGYLWSEMLDDDANGDRFRQMILSRGAPPAIDGMLRQRGLTK
jgi:peptidyl-dipeptidase Dcp